MGCFLTTCSITGLSIDYRKDIYIGFVRGDSLVPEVLPFLFEGEYDEYGSIENVKDSVLNKMGLATVNQMLDDGHLFRSDTSKEHYDSVRSFISDVLDTLVETKPLDEGCSEISLIYILKAPAEELFLKREDTGITELFTEAKEDLRLKMQKNEEYMNLVKNHGIDSREVRESGIYCWSDPWYNAKFFRVLASGGGHSVYFPASLSLFKVIKGATEDLEDYLEEVLDFVLLLETFRVLRLSFAPVNNFDQESNHKERLALSKYICKYIESESGR